MNSKILLIAQGSQSIQLVRELFALGCKPSEIVAITINENKNLSFQSFLEFYQIKKKFASHKSINDVLFGQLKKKFDLVISFSNPFIIPEHLISKSKFINFHPGWLPSYRGSLSTVYSLINKEKYVGGSWHYLTENVDKGNIIYRYKILINDNDTAFSLNHKIFSKGIMSLGTVLNKVDENYIGIKQNHKKGRFYYNQFPSLSDISDKELMYRIKFFPPYFE